MRSARDGGDGSSTIQKFDLFERRLRTAQEPTGSGQILRSVGEKREEEGGGIKK